MNEFEQLVHQRILNLRSIESQVRSITFGILVAKSSKAELETLRQLIRDCNKEGVADWIKFHNKKSIGEMSSVELKDRAKTLKITNYSRLSKLDLVQEIEEYEERRKAATHQQGV
jgi:hypothetical protein